MIGKMAKNERKKTSWPGGSGPAETPAPAPRGVTGARYGGVLYVDSLSEAGGPVPTYLDLLRVTSETIVDGLRNE